MSLESQIGSLVEAANNLTGTVANKVQEIDDKVLEAVKVIPELSRSFYVDAADGSDDNIGSESSPLKTVKEAMLRGGVIPFCAIHLRSGQTHIYEGREDGVTRTNVYHRISGALRILRYGSRSAPNPVLEMKVGPYGSDGDRQGIHFFAIQDYGSVFGYQVDLYIPPDEEFDRSPGSGVGSSVVGRPHGRFLGNGSFSWSTGTITLSPNYNLFANDFSGNYNINLYFCEIEDPTGTGDVAFVNARGQTLNLAIRNSNKASSLPSWGDMVSGKRTDASGTIYNVVSNLDLSE